MGGVQIERTETGRARMIVAAPLGCTQLSECVELLVCSDGYEFA